ncbi:MAG: NAD-dependent epimerase/dehydratase family protein [Acidimicrobiales bacterium]
MNRVLVTGGAGFIGSNLVDRLLAEGIDVDAVDNLATGSLSNLSTARSQKRARFSFHKLDICDASFEEFVAKHRPEVIFHLAAQIDIRVSRADPVADATSNILGTLRVLEASRKAGVGKVIYAASGGTLYSPGSPLPVREDAERRPVSHYGVSKAAGLMYLELYRELYDLEFTAIALANVYGPRQDPTGEAGVVAIFGDALLSGRECTIFGDGSQTRDFVYVDDVVDAFFRASDQGGGHVLNVSTGVEITIEHVYRTLARLVSAPLPPRYAPARLDEVAHSSLDPSLAKLHIGWEPWTTITVGLEATMKWMRTHLQGTDPLEFS